MLSSSLDTFLKLSKTTYPQKLFAYDCVTLYIIYAHYSNSFHPKVPLNPNQVKTEGPDIKSARNRVVSPNFGHPALTS